MKGTISAARVGRRALAASALATTILAAMLGVAADQALAAHSARVEAGTLKITGDSASDKLALRLQPGSPMTLQVDVGDDGTADFSFDRGTFTAIEIEARSGDDEVRIDQSGGSFPDESVTMDGGGGNDTLHGGSGAETFIGGGGADVITGGDNNDLALLGTGADHFVWNPGDDNDVVEGQSGDDALDFNGSAAQEAIDVSANGSRVRFTRNVANIVTDLDDVESVNFRAFGGADNVVVNDLSGTEAELVHVDLSAVGGGGDGQPDTVVARGTDGADEIGTGSGSGGIVVTGLAADVQVTGSEELNDNVNVPMLGGEDTFTMGLGSTSGPAPINVDGGDALDSVRYTGTAGDDAIAVLANGPEAAVFVPGTARLDAIAESLVLLGLAGTDTFSAVGNLAALTAITMDGGPGDDLLRGGNGADLLIGGDGEDEIDGNQGTDTALMGRHDDRFQWDPGDGNDTVEGQSGDDRLDFNGSAISENIEVSANGSRARLTRNIASIVMDIDDVELLAPHSLGGSDAIVVNDLAGTDVDDVHADLSAFGGGGDGQPDSVTARGTDGNDRVSLSSPLAFPLVSGLSAEVLVEGAELAHDDVNVATLGGNDTITTGREVHGAASYNVDAGDGDDVTRYNGTDVDDTISVLSNGAEVSTDSPLAARLDTTAVENLILLGLAGEDTMSGVGNLAPLTRVTMDGGADNDTLRGGNGADLLLGGDGNDHVDGNQGSDEALLGRGEDRFEWNPGDGNDVVDGQSGTDLVDFFGSAASENIGLSPDGSHLRLTRNIANIVMDVNNVEGVLVRAFGGTDTITVDDLKATDIDTVDADLSNAGGGGDAQPDTVVVNGTRWRDHVQVTRSGPQVLATGLAAETRIVGSEAAFDTLLVQTLDGNDDVTVAPDVSDLIATIVDLGTDE